MAYFGLSKEQMVLSLIIGSASALFVGTCLGMLSDLIALHCLKILFILDRRSNFVPSTYAPFNLVKRFVQILKSYTTPDCGVPLNKGIYVHDDIVKSVQRTIVAFIRSYEVTFRGQTDLNVNIVKAYKSCEPMSHFL